jgi:hypothetical protein
MCLHQSSKASSSSSSPPLLLATLTLTLTLILTLTLTSTGVPYICSIYYILTIVFRQEILYLSMSTEGTQMHADILTKPLTGVQSQPLSSRLCNRLLPSVQPSFHSLLTLLRSLPCEACNLHLNHQLNPLLFDEDCFVQHGVIRDFWATYPL